MIESVAYLVSPGSMRVGLFFAGFYDDPHSPGTIMAQLLSDLRMTVKSGVALALLWRYRAVDFRVNGFQLVALLVIGLTLTLLIGFVEQQPNPVFYEYALPVYAVGILALLLVSLFGGYLLGAQALTLAVVILSALLPVQLGAWLLRVQIPLDDRSFNQWLYFILMLVWLGLVLWRAVSFTPGRFGIRRGLVVALLFAALFGPKFYYADYAQFWYPSMLDDFTESNTDTDNAAYQAYAELDAETLLYRQPEFIDTRLAQLKAQRSGIDDWYMIGVGGYAQQAVFMHETRYAVELFERRFGSAGRSVTLINNLQTIDEQPLASATNLRRAINGVGQRMDRERDVLVLFLTSHGSDTHQLSFSFWPMPLNHLTPAMLKDYLDEAGIRWRVVIVSACYAGGFIEPLRDEYTLIMTASAADKRSFGCSNTREFTYFGEALLRDQLAQGNNLLDAFHHAAAALAIREQAEGLSPSQPQLFVGDKLATKLARFEP